MADMENVERSLQGLLQEQATMREQIKGALKRIDEQKALTESVHKLALSVELLTVAQKSTDTKVDRIQADMDEIKSKPAKRWDSAVWILVTAFLTGLVTYFLTKFGIN